MSENVEWPKSGRDPQWLEHHRSCGETYLLAMAVKCITHGFKSAKLANALACRLADGMMSMTQDEIDDLVMLADSCMHHFEIYPKVANDESQKGDRVRGPGGVDAGADGPAPGPAGDGSVPHRGNGV